MKGYRPTFAKGKAEIDLPKPKEPSSWFYRNLWKSLLPVLAYKYRPKMNRIYCEVIFPIGKHAFFQSKISQLNNR